MNSKPSDSAATQTLFAPSALSQAGAIVRSLPGYAPTPLHAMPALAQDLSIAELHLKYEAPRFGMNSFKASGGMLAVVRLVLRTAGHMLGRELEVADLDRPEVRAIAAGMTVACASAGNHGRAVAAGARLAGARAWVFVHPGVSQRRRDAIAQFGARVEEVAGSYDDSVQHAQERCDAGGWTMVSDTSWQGGEELPGWIMQGYTVMVDEALQALARPPTHVFVQAGVGGLAGAVAGLLAQRFGQERPCVVVVEPARAACLLETLRAGHPLRIAAQAPTVMSMLECYAPSPLAWRVLAHAADAFMAVDDSAALDAAARLAQSQSGDPALPTTPSGAAGVAGLLRAASDPAIHSALGLDGAARVLAIVSEGEA